MSGIIDGGDANPSRPRPHRPVDASFLSYIIPGALLVALGFLFFSNTTIDDAYTSLWPAWSLSHGRGIINYSGEHVEISSTLLWVLLIAFLNKSMGIGIVAAAYAAALIFGLAVTGLSTFVADQIKRGAGLYAGLLTATCLPVVNWSMSGMEMTLVAFLYLWTAYAWHLTLEKQRSPAFAVLPTWLAIMVRPEMPICLGLFSVFAMWQGWRKKTAASAVCLFFIVLTGSAALVAFRLWYFRAPFPQPVTAKTGGPLWPNVIDGLQYLAAAFTIAFLWPALAFAAYGAMRNAVLTFAAAVVIYLLFIVAVGGDFVQAGRFLVPSMPLICVIAGIGISELKSRRIVASAVLLAQLSACIIFALTDSRGMILPDAIFVRRLPIAHGHGWFEIANRGVLRDAEVAKYLHDLIAKADIGRDLIIASHQMGFALYNTAIENGVHIKVHDFFGLQDRILTERAGPVLIHGRLGIENGRIVYFNLVESGAITPPDVVYMFGPLPYSKYISDHYIVGFKQIGTVQALPFGRPVVANQYVLVRTELAKRLGISETVPPY